MMRPYGYTGKGRSIAVAMFWVMTAITVPVHASTLETVFTLADDGRTATIYFSNRSDRPGNPQFLFDKDFDRSLITYARPGNYQWSTRKEGKQEFTILRFPGASSYAYLQRLPSTKGILSRMKDNPNHYGLMVDGSSCHGDGCMVDESIVSVIIPTSYKVLAYGASVDGSEVTRENGLWKVVDNTYTFYMTKLRGAYVVFFLESAANYGYTKIVRSFIANKEIGVYNEGNRIRIVMPMDKMFDVGSAQMQPAGLRWIKTLAGTMSDLGYLELRVEGHTDSTPIVRRTQQGYSNNWDLSAARASNIVQFLAQQGLPAQKLAAVGYADARPLAGNDTADGRTRNRRIEFSIITRDAPASTTVETRGQEASMERTTAPAVVPPGADRPLVSDELTDAPPEVVQEAAAALAELEEADGGEDGTDSGPDDAGSGD